jgi:hypothetical protein
LGSLDLLFSDLLLAEMLSSQHEIAQPTGCWTIKSNSGVGLSHFHQSPREGLRILLFLFGNS